MTENYQSPEAVELGNGDSLIFGEKPGPDFDQATMSYARFIQNVIDVDEQTEPCCCGYLKKGGEHR